MVPSVLVVEKLLELARIEPIESPPGDMRSAKAEPVHYAPCVDLPVEITVQPRPALLAVEWTNVIPGDRSPLHGHCVYQLFPQRHRSWNPTRP
jgi:hypothetical protein